MLTGVSVSSNKKQGNSEPQASTSPEGCSEGEIGESATEQVFKMKPREYYFRPNWYQSPDLDALAAMNEQQLEDHAKKFAKRFWEVYADMEAYEADRAKLEAQEKANREKKRAEAKSYRRRRREKSPEGLLLKRRTRLVRKQEVTQDDNGTKQEGKELPVKGQKGAPPFVKEKGSRMKIGYVGDDTWLVEKIISSRLSLENGKGKVIEYLVKWLGWGV